MIRDGKRFQENDITFDIVDNYPITFINVQENNRKVLRIIFPDELGCLNEDEIEEKYKQQWQVKSNDNSKFSAT